MTGQSLNKHLPLKKNTTLHMALVIFPHNAGFLTFLFSLQQRIKKKKKKKLCNLYLLSKLGT